MSAKQYHARGRNAASADSVAGKGPAVRPVAGTDSGGNGTFTAAQLGEQAIRASMALARLGVGADDRVAVMLPMGFDSVVATLACLRRDALRITLPPDGVARPAELRERIGSTGAGVVVCADGSRAADGGPVLLKHRLDQALDGVSRVRAVLVVRQLHCPVPWTPGRDLWWHEALATVCH